MSFDISSLWQSLAKQYSRDKDIPWLNIAWRQTPETGSGVVAFTNWKAQVKIQKYIYWYISCHFQ